MMSNAATTSDPPFDLPPVRGRVTFDAPLSKVTWFRVGGPADVVFRPEDRTDLCAFLAALPKEVPVMVIGIGSNLLVRDGGVRGVVTGPEPAVIDEELCRLVAPHAPLVCAIVPRPLDI